MGLRFIVNSSETGAGTTLTHLGVLLHVINDHFSKSWNYIFIVPTYLQLCIISPMHDLDSVYYDYCSAFESCRWNEVDNLIPNTAGIKSFTLLEFTWWLKDSIVKLYQNIFPRTSFKKLNTQHAKIHHQICWVHLSYGWHTKLSYYEKALFYFQSACALTGNYFENIFWTEALDNIYHSCNIYIHLYTNLLC